MRMETMSLIDSLLSTNGILHSVANATDEELAYPYWTSEHSSLGSGMEDGIVDSELSLIGIGKSWLSLKQDELTILETLNGYRASLPSGSAVYLVFDSSIIIPCEDAELKRIEMKFSVKEFANG